VLLLARKAWLSPAAAAIGRAGATQAGRGCKRTAAVLAIYMNGIAAGESGVPSIGGQRWGVAVTAITRGHVRQR